VDGLAVCNGRCEGRRKQPTEKHGTGHQFVVIVPVGAKRVPYTFDKRIEAEAFAAAKTSAHLSGETFVTAKAARTLFRDVATDYITAKFVDGSISASSRDTLLGNLTRYAFPTLGHLGIGRITVTDVRSALAAVAHLAANTRRGLITEIRGVFRYAQQMRLVPRSFNPAQEIKLPEKTKSAVAPPTPESIDLIAAHLQDRYRALLYLAEGTGMRISELCGVTLDRLSIGADDGLMRIKVDRQLSKATRSAGPVFSELKTARKGIRERTITLDPELTLRMERHIETYCTPGNPLLFTVRGGAPLVRTYATGRLAAAMRAAGLKAPVGEVEERQAWHGFRHYHISYLLDGGVPAVEVRDRAGHTNLTTTLDTYAHRMRPDESKTIAVMQRARRGPRAVPRASETA
jgi:integrase